MKVFTEYKQEAQFKRDESLTEEDMVKIDEALKLFESECGGKLENIDEGFLGKLAGGVGGLLLGPSLGKIIANALGIERGVLYDLFCSRLVGIALGAAIGKHLTEKR